MTEEYAGPRKPCDLVHGGDECAAVDEGYWGDDEEEIAFVKRWNCDPKTLGAYGEDLACELLKRNDYIILERNWSCAAGEADIIALDDGCLVFVEVKTRSSEDFAPAAEAVTLYKKRNLIAAARAYLAR